MSYLNIPEFPTCGECNHACHWQAYWWKQYLDPYCEITKLSVKHDDSACEYFYGNGMRIMKLVVKFKQKYYRQIVRGVKTQTMRLPAKRIDVSVGEKVIALFPNGEELLLRITNVGYKYFKSINDDDAKREGFGSADELKEELLDIYSDYMIEDSNRFYYYQFEYLGLKR